MRPAALFLIAASAAFIAGCSIVGATAGAVGTVASTSIKAAGTVVGATVKTTGRVVGAAVSSSGEVTATGMESAAKLAKTGMVVAVDAGSGAITEMPWQQGMELALAAQNGKFDAAFNTAKIYRQGRVITADMEAVRAGAQKLALQSGDVVEFAKKKS
jgi:sugar lactone lactonase YvrE